MRRRCKSCKERPRLHGMRVCAICLVEGLQGATTALAGVSTSLRAMANALGAVQMSMFILRLKIPPRKMIPASVDR